LESTLNPCGLRGRFAMLGRVLPTIDMFRAAVLDLLFLKREPRMDITLISYRWQGLELRTSRMIVSRVGLLQLEQLRFCGVPGHISQYGFNRQLSAFHLSKWVIVGYRDCYA
jgi:hypothetical protein